MKSSILNIIYILIFLCIIIFLFKLTSKNEGFQNSQLTQTFIDEYHKFSTFYNTFMKNWEKAIITSVQLEKPSPSESSSSPPLPSRNELNEYIILMSRKKDIDFPKITDPLPNMIELTSLKQYKDIIPKESSQYMHALEWMNQQMSESQKNLNSSLKGEGFITKKMLNVDGFDNNMCQDLSQCFVNNPELIAQLLKAQNDAEEKQNSTLQDEFITRFKKINEDTSLQNLLKINQDLIKKSDDIQKQAQSGELLSQLNIPSEPSISYQMPIGANGLNDLQKSDPTKYKEYSEKYKQLFDMKQLMDQINSNLH